jgi:hypothetical protein
MIQTRHDSVKGRKGRMADMADPMPLLHVDDTCHLRFMDATELVIER